MYQDFYRLADRPFALLPDPRFFYGSRAHQRAMSYMRFGLRQGEGFIVVTGPVGTGKSMLAAQLLAEIDPKAIFPVHVATTQVGAAGALRLIADALGADLKSGSKTVAKDRVLRAIEEQLLARRHEGRRVLLVVDEAQNLPFATLEELRMISNMNVCGEGLVQCFLLGQPNFAHRLLEPRLEQLRQRVVASCRLEAMSEWETYGYIAHRLATAGWAGDPEFEQPAVARIHQATGGIPRRINSVCARLLFFGALEELHRIDVAAVEAVLDDLAAELPPVKDQAAPLDDITEAEGSADHETKGDALLRRIVRAQSRAIRELAVALDAAAGGAEGRRRAAPTEPEDLNHEASGEAEEEGPINLSAAAESMSRLQGEDEDIEAFPQLVSLRS